VTPGVVLVTHESRDHVLAALASIERLARTAGRVVVVDSGSSDGTAAAVHAAHADVDVLELDNVGYARAANAGVRRLPAEVDAVLIANADVVVTEGAVEQLVAVLDGDQGVALVGPRVRYPDGAHQASARRSPDLATAVVHGLVGWIVPSNPATRRYHALDLTGPDAHDACDVDWVSGCAFMVRRSAFERVGGFDAGYRLFVEDVDLCDRLRSAGHRVRFAPSALVVHHVGASTSTRPLRSRIAHAQGLDRYVAARLHGGARALRPLLWSALAGWVLATSVAGHLRAGRSTTGERTGRSGSTGRSASTGRTGRGEGER
jgi:N-acetylglucosaminyl-diphospho-decaprenol L-rhamnosyltransferase